MEGSEINLAKAEELVMKWDSLSSAVVADLPPFLFSTDGDRTEADGYLRAVDFLGRRMKDTPVSVSSPRRISFASGSVSSIPAPANALQSAMARLEHEFRHILVSRSIELEIETLVDLNSLSMSSTLSGELLSADENLVPVPEPVPDSNSEEGSSKAVPDSNSEEGSSKAVPDSNSEEGSSTMRSLRSRRNTRFRSMCSMREIDLLPPDAIEDLRNIAYRMIANGYGRECVQVYGSARKPAVDQCLRRLGMERISIGDVQRLDWEAVETKIRRWTRSARVAIRIVFASEKNLCQMIFGEEGLADAPFAEAVKGSALQVLGFPEAISIGRRSSEKLFKVLDLHDSLSDLLFDISVIFSSKSTESIYIQAEEIVSRLADAVRGILSEFENAVFKDPSRVAVPGGTIHPLTRYVMNYIILISDYKQTLTQLITARPTYRLVTSEDVVLENFDFPESESENESPLTSHLVWIIFVLKLNLITKSNLYKDGSLTQLFMMNNLHYIVHKVKDTKELHEIVGDGHLRPILREVGRAAANYQRATWIKILDCLKGDGIQTGGFTSSVSKSTLRERFKAFNASLEEAHRIQSTWFVPDTQLREELRISIDEKLLPAYRSFLGRFGQHIQNGKHAELYIKYSVEDLEEAILDFFEGVQAPLLSKRKSH